MLPPVLLTLTFWIPEISETVKDSPAKLFGTVSEKFFDGRT